MKSARVLVALSVIAALISGADLASGASADGLPRDAAPADGVAFDGHSSCGSVADGRALDLDSFSVAAWVKLRQTAGSQVFVNRGEPGTQFTLYLYDGRVRMLVEYQPGHYTHANVPAPPADTWVHYAGTYDGQQIRIYVGGQLQQSVEAGGRLPPSQAGLWLGCAGPSLRVLDGWLEEACVWNRALAEEEVAELVGAASAETLPPGLLGRWTLASLEGQVWKNEMGSELVAEYRKAAPQLVRKDDGYRGIWYSNQAQDDQYVYKYSGGLGTYCMKHRPLAVYSEQANKTFFCYGGTDPERRTLLHTVSYYDHATGMVPRPTILLDKHTDDAHDNPVIALDDKGYVWIFSSSHGTSRPSYLSVSKQPYSIDDFEQVLVSNFSYTQPYHLAGKGFLFLHTRYGGGRRLFQTTSSDGRQWSEPQMLAHIEQGHYQISWPHGDKIGTAFNYHPAPQGLNWRTNLYYLESDDLGRTWRNAAGQNATLPITEPENLALVREYRSENRNVYMKDLAFDSAGNPVILYLTSGGWESGPKNDPRTWQTARWTGSEWDIQGTITSDNNYDSGSLYIERDDLWRIIGPTQPGPQAYNTGGEVAIWTSSDQGKSWTMQKQLTQASEFNHTYCRKPLNAHADFYAIWADGHAREKSPSQLYFTNRQGDHVWRLPAKMSGEFAQPEIAW